MLFGFIVCFFRLGTLDHASSWTVFFLLCRVFWKFFPTLLRVSIRLAALAFIAIEKVFDLICPVLLFKNFVKFWALIIFGFLDLFQCGINNAEENIEENELEGNHHQYVDAWGHVWIACVHLIDHVLVLHDDQNHSYDRRPDRAEFLLIFSVEKLAAAAVAKKNDR